MELMALVAAAFGLWLILFPQREVNRVERRIAAGDDRFFEEQRAYWAYPPLRTPTAIRYKGLLLLILGALGLLI